MRHLVHVLVLTGTVIFSGCGGEPGLDGTITVTGTVSYQGQPVEGAIVMFSPEGEGRAASGRTDASGRFQLTTLKPDDGALPGRYKVALSKTEVEGAEMTSEEARAYYEKHRRAPTVTSKELLPEKYKKTATSGLMAEVTEGGENNFPFDLVD